MFGAYLNEEDAAVLFYCLPTAPHPHPPYLFTVVFLLGIKLDPFEKDKRKRISNWFDLCVCSISIPQKREGFDSPPPASACVSVV